MTGPADHTDKDVPESQVEQLAEVSGSENTTVQAAGDAYVTVHYHLLERGGYFVRYVAPSLLSALLPSILRHFDQVVGVRAQITATVLVVLWMAWAARRDSHLSWARRAALPIVALAYTAAMTSFAALPQAPASLQIVVPAALWIAAASIILHLVEPERREQVSLQYLSVAAIGLGIAMLGLGVTMISDHEVLLGAGMITCAIATIVFGLTFISDRGGAGTIGFGAAIIGFGAAMIVFGTALIAYREISGGAAMIGGGIVVIVGGVVTIAYRPVGREITAMGGGIAAMGGGIAAIVFGIALISDREILAGTAIIALGIATSVGAVAIIFDREILLGTAAIGLGIAASGGGVVVIFDREILSGTALIGCGIAMLGLGIRVVAAGRASSCD